MKSNKKAYNTIINNLDKLVELQETLNKANFVLAHWGDENTNSPKIQKVKQIIENLKHSIKTITIETQELILTSCAYSDLNFIRDNESIIEFKNKLYKFKNLLIKPDNYSFYNEFYCHMMEQLEHKRELIKKYGILNCFKEIRENFALIEVRQEKLNLFEIAIMKFKKLFHIGQENKEYNKS